MTIAVPAMPSLLPAASRARSQIFRVEVCDSVSAAAPYWDALERDGALMTPYQRRDFLEAWQANIGATEGVTPLIAVGLDGAGAPLTLWPLGRRAMGAMQIAEFLGGKHANYNFVLWRRDAAAHATRADLDAMRARLARECDALILSNQPESWHGIANPLLAWPHQYSPGFGYRGALQADFDSLLRSRTNSDARKKMRKKLERLSTQGAVSFVRAADPAETECALSTFFSQKRARMKAQGLPDIYADQDVQHFITDAVRRGAIEIYTLSAGDLIVATVGGIAAGGRFCTMFSSIIPDRFANESPGEQSMVAIARACAERGLRIFDLGVGDARYKALLCPEQEPLFDSFIGLTPRGRIVAALAREVAGIKRLVKQSPLAWSLVEKARRVRAKLR